MNKKLLVLPLALAAVLAGGAVKIVQDQCGPFTDVTPGFCPYVLELYYLGITVGTSATTFSPDDPLTRGQAAVFVAKGLNQSLARFSRRAALGQWWTTTPHYDVGLGVTAVGSAPYGVVSDGEDVWVTLTDALLARVRASDGKLLETRSAPISPLALLSAMGRIFVTSNFSPFLYMIDPSQPAAPAVVVSQAIGEGPYGLAFDGSRIWVTGSSGTVSIVTPGPTTPWAVTTVSTGFQAPGSITFDGASMWVGDQLAESLFRVDANGAIIQTVPVGGEMGSFAFDGRNLWVPVLTGTPSVVIVDASSGNLVTTLTGNGLTAPIATAFDGERVLVIADNASASLWTAADLRPLGSFFLGTFSSPTSVCSDGLNFWIVLSGTGQLARF